jgi:hypothetical protein
MGKLLRSVLILSAVVGLISSAGCSPKPAGPGDRPPIIISDGSVLFRAVAKDRGNGTNKYRGKWFQDGSVWYHDDSVNQPAKILRVNVLASPSGTGTEAGQCTNDDFDFDVREFTLTYTRFSDGTPVSFRVFIQPPGSSTTAPGRLAVESTAMADVLPYWLKVGVDGDTLSSIRFPNGTECKLTAKVSQVHIYQKINP